MLLTAVGTHRTYMMAHTSHRTPLTPWVPGVSGAGGGTRGPCSPFPAGVSGDSSDTSFIGLGGCSCTSLRGSLVVGGGVAAALAASLPLLLPLRGSFRLLPLPPLLLLLGPDLAISAAP